MHDLPAPSHYEYNYKTDEQARRLKLYGDVVRLYAEYYVLCQADGDSDRDPDRAGYGRYGGTTDFDRGTTSWDRLQEVQELKWKAAQEVGKGIVSAYAGDAEGALQSFAAGLELEVEAWKKDIGGAIDGVQDFFSRD
jgi:hypothetical protein